MNMRKEKTNLSRTRQIRRYILPFLMILAGIVLSASAFTVVLNWDRQKIRTAFEEDATERYETFKREIEFDLHVLDSVKALYEHGHKIDRSQFRDFVRYFLVRHPSIQALEWIPCISHSQRESYEEAARRDGFPHFQITDRKTQGEMVRSPRARSIFLSTSLNPIKAMRSR